MPDKKWAVVVLNWNGQRLLERYLPSVAKHSPQAQIYVIDNASTDDSLAYLERTFPAVQIIALERNWGFAGGYNKGLEEVKEPWAVLLNSDVEVSPDWLTPLEARFKDDSSVVALQPKILDHKRPQFFEYAGAAGGFLDRLAYPFCRGRLFEHLEEDQGQYDQYREVFWASGACMAVRLHTFRELGGFYEKLFAHMEEIDLCWRMQLAGYRIACEPSSTVYHLGGATLQEASPRKSFLNFRNSLIINVLNLPLRRIFPVLMQRMLLDGAAGFKFLLEGRPRHLQAILQAHAALYRFIPALIKERRRRQAFHDPQAKVKGRLPVSIVALYFLRGKRRFTELESTLSTHGNLSSDL